MRISSLLHPEVSIIMPCYNAEQSVGAAIKSILNQTFQHWELIVVDDGSSDLSSSIVETYSCQEKRIRLIRQQHQGVVAASNNGLAHAQATVIARMDADDVARPDRILKQLEALKTNPRLGAVTCLAEFAGSVESAGGYAHHVAWTNSHLTTEQISLNRFVDLPFPHPTLMYRRELTVEHGSYRQGDFPEDYEMILRWMDAGVRIGKVNEILYDWHDPPTRLSRNDPRYAMMAFHQCKAPYLRNAILRAISGQRELWIWGAGRPARKCARPLELAWKPAAGFIDIDPHKIGGNIQGRPVISADELPRRSDSVIVSYVGTRGARDKIRAQLLKDGRIEGVDFWLAS